VQCWHAFCILSLRQISKIDNGVDVGAVIDCCGLFSNWVISRLRVSGSSAVVVPYSMSSPPKDSRRCNGKLVLGVLGNK